MAGRRRSPRRRPGARPCRRRPAGRCRSSRQCRGGGWRGRRRRLRRRRGWRAPARRPRRSASSPG
ncbi:hypothetical protein CA235_04875 [Sphingomonas sp. ABOLF]|nr:hypothetical protein CA235_04875 [Sphingomonas sp. ABOLF]